MKVFVTVGTHEQPFDRLLRAVATLERTSADIQFRCQTGYSTTEVRDGRPFLSYDEMQAAAAWADVVVSHGGPGSILPVLAMARPLVVVPRLYRHGEHVDDHQLAFARRVAQTHGCSALETFDSADLKEAIRGAVHRRPGAASESSATPERSLDQLAHQVLLALGERTSSREVR